MGRLLSTIQYSFSKPAPCATVPNRITDEKQNTPINLHILCAKFVVNHIYNINYAEHDIINDTGVPIIIHIIRRSTYIFRARKTIIDSIWAMIRIRIPIRCRADNHCRFDVVTVPSPHVESYLLPKKKKKCRFSRPIIIIIYKPLHNTRVYTPISPKHCK